MLPASVAQADSYCVDTTGCDHSTGVDLQQALTQAQLHAGPDTVRIGPAPAPRAGGFSYSSADAVHIEGNGGRAIGSAGTILDGSSGTPTNETILEVLAPGSTIKNLSVRIPEGSVNLGIETNAAMSNLLVFAKPASDSPIGVLLRSGATLSGSDVLLPVAIGTAVELGGAGTTVTDSRLAGASGYTTAPGAGANATGVVRRTRIEFGGSGVFTREGKITLEDSLFVGRVDDPFTNIGISMTSFAPGTSVTANHVTFIGPSSAGAIAFRAENGAGAGNTASIVFRNGVVTGFPIAFKRTGNTGTANIRTDYSNYGGTTTQSGAGSIMETNRVLGAPGLVDYRPTSGSILVDAGDPAGLAAGESATDVAGQPRIVDGTGDCVARRDLGAFEYVPGPRPPRAVVTPSATKVLTGQEVTFSAAGSCDPDGGALGYAWFFDGVVGASGPSAKRSFATPGTHSVTLRVDDVSGRFSTATVFVQVSFPPYAGLRIPKQTTRASRSGRVKVRVRCPAGTVGTCAGTLRLAGRTASLKVAPGALKRITVKLSKARLAALRKAKRQKLTARATTHDANGTQKTTSRKVTVLAPR